MRTVLTFVYSPLPPLSFPLSARHFGREIIASELEFKEDSKEVDILYEKLYNVCSVFTRDFYLPVSEKSFCLSNI